MPTTARAANLVEHDLIVVGAGSAGAVLAARLSEDRHRAVLLLESGPDYRSPATPAAIQSLDSNEIVRGGFPPPDRELAQRLYPDLAVRRTARQPLSQMVRGRGVGGSSAINGLFAVRPTVEDLDGWAEAGACGWSFERVLPLLNRLEDDSDFGRVDYHGSGGPIPVVRPGDGDLLPIDEAFRQAALHLGHRWAADHNAPLSSGLSPYAYNARDGVRVSTNDGYLEPARARDNLTVLGGARVDRVLLQGRRAVGVQARHRGATAAFRAGEVILAAGAVHTPAILMRSGIGPAQHLRSLGIDVVSDLPVGHGLQDHPALVLNLRTGDARQDRGTRPARLCLRWGLGATREPADAMVILLSTALAPGIASLMGWLNRVRSTGRVTLASKDPAAAPVVDSNLLSHPDDLGRMMRVVEHMKELACQPAMGEHVRDAELLATDPRLLVGAPAQAGTGLALLERGIDAHDLERFILGNLRDAFHISGTCRMGAADDPQVVVDQAGRVLGIDNLRVGDASIFPWVPSANTHLSAVLVGEKVADTIRRRGVRP